MNVKKWILCGLLCSIFSVYAETNLQPMPQSSTTADNKSRIILTCYQFVVASKMMMEAQSNMSNVLAEVAKSSSVNRSDYSAALEMMAANIQSMEHIANVMGLCTQYTKKGV